MTALRDHRLAVLTQPKDFQQVAELLSETVGMRPLDALIAVRQAPAVLPPVMTAGESQAMVALLHGLGIRAIAVPVVDLPDFENAVVVHHARCLPTAFEILDRSGASLGEIPWLSIAVAAIGALPGEKIHRYTGQARTVVSAAPMPELGLVEAPESALMELWILRRNHTAAYRIDHRRFNYEDLGELKTTSATANFRLFAKEFVSHLAASSLPDSTCAYLGQEPLSRYQFASREELQRAALLHWVIFRASMTVADQASGN